MASIAGDSTEGVAINTPGSLIVTAESGTDSQTHGYFFNKANANDDVGSINLSAIGTSPTFGSCPDAPFTSEICAIGSGAGVFSTVGAGTSLYSGTSTISFWYDAAPSDLSTRSPVLTDTGVGTGCTQVFELSNPDIPGGHMGWYYGGVVNCGSSGQSYGEIDLGAVSSSVWHMYTLTNDGSFANVYIDGILAAGFPNASTGEDASRRTNLLGDPNGAWAQGAMRDVYVDSTALTAVQVWNLHAAQGSIGSPAVEITPSYLVFPTAGSTLPLTITNSGTAPIEITLPQSLGGLNSFDFTVASGTTCTNGAIVASGDSCVIHITFTPWTTSAETATLSLFDNASNSPQLIPLSGGGPLASILPNPVAGSRAAQTVTLTGSGFATGAVLNWKDLTNGGSGPVTPLTVASTQITAVMDFTNRTAAWQLQVANPSGPATNWFSFEVLGSEYSYVADDYPFPNATPDAKDPYKFTGFRECTSFVAFRMNRDAGTSDPSHPYFFRTMGGQNWGNADTWNINALSLGYAVDSVAEAGAIAQWTSGTCGGTCSNGHVAYVERVNRKKDGSVASIVVSEYNFPESTKINHQFNVRTIAATADHFPPNFIHVISLRLGSNLLNFGTQPLRTSTPLRVTITNPSAEAIPMTGIRITGTNARDFTQTNNCGVSVPPEGSCEITVTLMPIEQGPLSALLTVEDTARTPIKETITLMGSGNLK